MATTILTGRDTIVIDGRVIVELVGMGAGATLRHPNTLANMTTGKNGATVVAENSQGINAELELHVLRGSSDDKFLNSRMSNQRIDLTNFPLLNASVVKQLGSGVAGVSPTRDVYTLEGGFFVQNVDTEVSFDGSTEQGVSIYMLQFASSKRSLE